MQDNSCNIIIIRTCYTGQYLVTIYVVKVHANVEHFHNLLDSILICNPAIPMKIYTYIPWFLKSIITKYIVYKYNVVHTCSTQTFVIRICLFISTPIICDNFNPILTVKRSVLLPTGRINLKIQKKKIFITINCSHFKKQQKYVAF